MTEQERWGRGARPPQLQVCRLGFSASGLGEG